MKRRLALASFAFIASATCLLAGRPGVVKTIDDQTIEGDITERADEVVIRQHGVDTVLPRDRVSSIDYTAYDNRFEQSLAALQPDDVDGRVALARDAFDRRDYLNAMKAVQSALDINPLNREARQLDATINTQIQLESRTAAANNTAIPTTGSSAATRPGRRIRELDEDQINRIRQLELSRDDHVHIQFRDNVRKRFVDSQPGMNYAAFASREDVDQALTIIGKGTREMVDDVRIRNDPWAIQSFGRRVQTAMIQGCATSVCHGGSHAGDFRLITNAPDAATMITNFYLVTQYAKKLDPGEVTGPFTPNAVPMVARGDAFNSLLYQFSMPRARAKFQHPAVRGWDGLFRNDDDRLARDMSNWMNNELARLRTDYGFTYAIVDGRAMTSTTQPATEATDESTTQPTSMPGESADDHPFGR